MNLDYIEEDNKPMLYWFLRDMNGKRIKRKLGFIGPHAWNNDPSSGPPVKDIFGRTVYEWKARMPSEIGGGRDRYAMTCEADVLFPMRAMIDMGIYCGVEIGEDNVIRAVESHGIAPLYSLFDFEYFSPKEIMPMPQDAKWPAITVQWGLTSDNIIHIIVLNFTSLEQAPLGTLSDSCIAASDSRRALWSSFKSITVHIELRDEQTGKWLIEPQYLTYPVQVTVVDDERDLFIDFAKWHMGEPIPNQTGETDIDGWAGYNSNNYDWPMYLRRADRLGISWAVSEHISPLHRASARFNVQYKKWDVHIWGRTIADLNDIYKKYVKPVGERTSYDLKIVVADECGLHYQDLGAYMKESYENDPQSLIEYAAKDVIALKLLNEKCDLLPYIDVLRRTAGTLFDKSTSNKVLVDTMCLRLAGAPLPTGTKHEKLKKAKGALVITPTVGLHQWVMLLDLKSIYPSMIIAYNLSPECKDPNGEIQIPIVDDQGRTTEVIRYRRSPIGVLPKVADHLMALRERYRALGREIESHPGFDVQYRERIKSQETVAKFIACSLNGVLAYPGFRLYDPEVFNCVTSITRSVIWKVRQFLEPRGLKIMYADTDSLFVRLTSATKETAAEEAFKIEADVQEYINEWTKSLGATYPIEIKFENLFDRILWKRRAKGDDPAKKHYGGHYVMKDGVWKEGMKISGLAPRSSANALFTRKLTTQFLNLVLGKNDIDSAVEVVRQAWNSILTIDDVSMIGIPKGLHQANIDLENLHGSTKPWIEGVEHANKVFGWRFNEDDKPKLIYTIPTAMFPYKTLCLNSDQTKVPNSVRINWSLQREKVLKNKFFELLEAIGRDWSEIEFKVRKTKMSDYFG